jgi:predicted nucleic acid-binding protein
MPIGAQLRTWSGATHLKSALLLKKHKADYLVSGDQDLLVLGEYEGTRVVTPRQFLAILDAQL